MEKFWGSSPGQLVQCPAQSSSALKVWSGYSGPPPVQFENLPRWGSTVTAYPKALSLWNFFLLLIVTVVLLLCILGKHVLCPSLYSPLDGWMAICYCNASCLLPLAGSASLAPSPFLNAGCCSPILVLLAFLQLCGT